MDTYNVEFYDLLSRAGIFDSAQLQGYFDEVMANKYNQLQLDGFEWDEMQLDFTYEQLQGEVGLNVMAQYVDLDSPAKPIGHQPIQLGTGKIPRMKMVEYFNEDKLRKQYILEQRFGAGSDRVRNAAMNNLFNTMDTLIGGHTNSLTYQRHQIVSTGKFTLTSTNNPQGIIGQTFAAHVPSANVTTKTGTARWWTNSSYTTEGSAADPIKDLQAMVKVARNLGVSGHFEVDSDFLDTIMNHSKVLAAIGQALFPLSGSTDSATAAASVQGFETKKGVLERILGVPIKAIDSVVTVEKWDASSNSLVRPTFRAFETNVIVFVPNGIIGSVKTVEPIALPGGEYASFYDGRLLVTVGKDYVKKCQSFNSEMTSLCVPKVPKYFWYLHPYNAS